MKLHRLPFPDVCSVWIRNAAAEFLFSSPAFLTHPFLLPQHFLTCYTLISLTVLINCLCPFEIIFNYFLYIMFSIPRIWRCHVRFGYLNPRGKRKFSLISVHSNFPATMHRFQLQPSSRLFDHKEQRGGYARDGVSVSEEGLVYPMLSRSFPCLQRLLIVLLFPTTNLIYRLQWPRIYAEYVFNAGATTKWLWLVWRGTRNWPSSRRPASYFDQKG